MNLHNLLTILDLLQSIWNVVLAIMILLIMITIHELGHYVAGKIFKFKINEFAIGMGPALYKRTKSNGEVFSIRALPLGGFCAFDGEDEQKDNPEAFNNKPFWQRIIVLASGALMNALLAIIVIIISFSAYGQTLFQAYEIAPPTTDEAIYQTHSLESEDVIIAIDVDDKKTNIFMATDLVVALNGLEKGKIVNIYVARDGEYLQQPIEVALRTDVDCKNITEINKAYASLGLGSIPQITTTTDDFELKTFDYLMRINDNEAYEECSRIFTINDFTTAIANANEGDVVGVYLSRDGQRQLVDIQITAELAQLTQSNEILAKLNISGIDYIYNTSGSSVKLGFFNTIARAFEYAFKIGGSIFTVLGQLVTGTLGINAVGGTITTIATASEIVGYGFKYFLEIMAFIGMNLAVVNLLPIPALDGSRIVFCLIEGIRKKPINRNIEAIIHFVGLIFLLGFAVLVDILQFI